MFLVRAKGLLLITVASCCVMTPLVRAQSPPAAAQQGAVTIDLKNALQRARDNSQQLQSANIDMSLAREDRTQAKAVLLPSLNYFNQYIYTQGNGTEPGVFISNDGVHVYNSQAQVHQELFSPARLADYRRTIAAQSLAAAKRDIVERGLVATVVQSYYAAVAAQRKFANAQRALEEAQRFVDITEKLEKGGEVAHADVLKARLVLQQRQRDVQDAQLGADKARIALAVLMFPDYRLDFNLVDDLNSVSALPAYGDFENQAKAKSPELRAAEESVRQEEFGIQIARAAYLPTLSFDYFFGINANQFAAHDEEGRNHLGSSAQATLNIPVWNWWSTKSKVHQADMKRQQAQLDLELTRKQFISNLHALYLEAQGALAQLDSLRRSMDDSAESLRLTSLRYEAGEVSVLEVVDAQSTLAQARNAYDDGLSRYRLALAGIQTLIGTI
ncbi:MAG: TolC family protein [Acidobacteriota bacterium]